MTKEDRVDLHYITADLECEVCQLAMADYLVLQADGRARAYHENCIQEDRCEAKITDNTQVQP